MRVALVHDWLTAMRGGERCLEALCDLFPNSEIFTLIHRPHSVSEPISAKPIHTSFLQRLPGATSYYRHLLPLFPAAVERLPLAGFDLVISTSHCVAKGAQAPPGVPHLCYCFTPMRYLWDQYESYFSPGQASWPVRRAMAAVAPSLRRWDRESSKRVTRFVAISRYVQERIDRCYGRAADIVYPPVDLTPFRSDRVRGNFFLAAGALVPYKRFDLAIAACNRLRARLIVAGAGPERKRLERLAGPTIEFTGWVDDAELARLLGECRALVFPGVEDFGLIMVEAHASGAPVIAYDGGGAQEIVVQDPSAPTGVFFGEQTGASLASAIERFDGARFDPAVARANAARFSVERFRAGILEQVRQVSIRGDLAA